MSLPRVWPRLPGPTDFLDTILEDLVDRTAVLIGLPEEVPSEMFAVEMADLVKHRGLGNWEPVRSTEACSTAPSDSIARRFRGGKAAGSVLWIDAKIEDAAAAEWVNHAARVADFPNMPRLCVSMHEACAAVQEEERRVRRRLWRDFVTLLDSRALVERVGRRSGHQPLHIALKSALIAEISGADLALAERLSRDPVGRILQPGRHSHERIWAAQLSVLLPLVEHERRRMLAAHQTLWKLPHVRKDGTEIRQLKDLEVGDMAVQAQSGESLEFTRKRLVWLRSVRNALAHNKIVPWATLTSPVGIQIMDFR